MLKLAQLKYPNFPTRVTPSQATVSLSFQHRWLFGWGMRPSADVLVSFDRSRQFMYQETAYFSLDYGTEVESLADPEKMARMSKIVQFEHASTVSQICIAWWCLP
jgi:actin-related protein 5